MANCFDQTFYVIAVFNHRVSTIRSTLKKVNLLLGELIGKATVIGLFSEGVLLSCLKSERINAFQGFDDSVPMKSVYEIEKGC